MLLIGTFERIHFRQSVYCVQKYYIDVGSKIPPDLLPWQTRTDSKEKAIKLENEKAIHLKRFGSSPVPFIVITKYTIELQPSNDFSASTIMEWYSNFMLQYSKRQQQIKKDLIIFSIWLDCFHWMQLQE